MRRHVTSACRLTLLYITPERAENYILAYYSVFFSHSGVLLPPNKPYYSHGKDSETETIANPSLQTERLV